MANDERATKPSSMQPAGPKGDGPDTDNDGMSDDYETNVWGSDPKVADSDGDGLSDLAEWWVDTNPRQKDTDGDGWEDGEDLVFGDPLRQNPGGKERADFLKRTREYFDKEGSDKDGDFVRDHVEEQEGTRKDLRDSDNDGLDDRLEIQLRRQDVDVDPTGEPDDRSDLDKARQRLDERREVTDALPTREQSAQVEPVDGEESVASFDSAIAEPDLGSPDAFSSDASSSSEAVAMPEVPVEPVETPGDFEA